MAQLDLLSDDNILDYTSEPGGRQRILTDHRDVNLKFRPFKPYPGGIYDVSIFGSPIQDQCICGKIRTVSSEPCPNCGCRVYSIEEGLRRFARIELPFYYLPELRYELFQDLFNSIFSGSKITLKFADPDLRKGGYSGRGAKKLNIKVFDSCQFEYDASKKELTISEFITDMSKCSYEGLLEIIERDFPEQKVEFKKLINRLYLVQPTMIRPFTFTIKDGKKMVGPNPLSTWYSIIIRLCCADDTEAGELNYATVLSKFKTPGEKVRYTALLRALLNAGKDQATSLLNTSKKNLARNIYSLRTKNSARCPIIPSTTLAVDEVSVPRHLAYEMCRSGFCEYLQSELNFTKEEATRSTREEYENPEIQKLFKEYAEKQIVIEFSHCHVRCKS